jgi:hypothetical protein
LRAHQGQDRTGHVEGAEEVGLHLRAELLGTDVLEVAGVEIASVVDQHVDATEPLDGCPRCVSGSGRISDVELHRQHVLVIADRVEHALRVAAGCDNGVASGESLLSDVDPQPAPGAGDEPNLIDSHDVVLLLVLGSMDADPCV